jgi:hypothetical protein
MYYNNNQGKVLNHYTNKYYTVTVVQTQEQIIENNPAPNSSVPVIDCSRRAEPVSRPQPVKQPDAGSYGRSYTKYVNSDGMNFGITISSDMDL